MASTVAETLAERFWQQVMKRKKKTRCFKGKLHWEMCSAQLLCERGSFHIQQHLGPLPELQGWGQQERSDLHWRQEKPAAPGFPREHQSGQVLRSHLLSLWFGVFWWWCLELSSTPGIVFSVRWVCSEPLVLQSLAGMKCVAWKWGDKITLPLHFFGKNV